MHRVPIPNLMNGISLPRKLPISLTTMCTVEYNENMNAPFVPPKYFSLNNYCKEGVDFCNILYFKISFFISISALRKQFHWSASAFKASPFSLPVGAQGREARPPVLQGNYGFFTTLFSSF